MIPRKRESFKQFCERKGFEFLPLPQPGIMESRIKTNMRMRAIDAWYKDNEVNGPSFQKV